MNNRAYIIDVVAAYDVLHKTSYVKLLEPIRDISSRTSFPMHVTASVYPVSSDGECILQILHKSLQVWLQPGGHIEVDELPHMAAARECLEETGLVIDAQSLEGMQPHFIDIHKIPKNPRNGEPEHYHCDLQYIAYAHGDVQMNADEVRNIAWVPWERLRLSNETIMEALRSYAQKK